SVCLGVGPYESWIERVGFNGLD
ncbi:hypothetical protein A2U01_0063372, partial [Trifolium medium]|nr:hypothetical protein [Trifolium medium]